MHKSQSEENTLMIQGCSQPCPVTWASAISPSLNADRIKASAMAARRGREGPPPRAVLGQAVGARPERIEDEGAIDQEHRRHDRIEGDRRESEAEGREHRNREMCQITAQVHGADRRRLKGDPGQGRNDRGGHRLQRAQPRHAIVLDEGNHDPLKGQDREERGKEPGPIPLQP